MVALCTIEGIDNSRWMVQQGQAVAFRKYSLDYLAEEDAAKAVKIGIWGANSKIHPNSLTSLGGKCHVRDTAPPAIDAEPKPEYDLHALPPQEGADA